MLFRSAYSQGGVPIVYFNSLTYQLKGTVVNDSSYYFNFYSPGLVYSTEPGRETTRNCARPFLSNEVDPALGGALRYANSKTFQIMNGGYDRIYGCQSIRDLSRTPAPPTFLFTSPGGNRAEIGPGNLFFTPPQSAIRYYNPEFDVPGAPISRTLFVDDNSSNFIDGPTFGQSQ
mgnify:FL=1